MLGSLGAARGRAAGVARGGASPPGDAGGGGRPWQGAAATVGAGSGLFFLYLLSFPDPRGDAYILIDDGVWYMRMVEAGVLMWLLHPHHLLYHLQPFALYQLLVRWWPPPEASLWAHRLVDAAYGAAGVLLFWRAVERIVGGRWAAGLAASGLAVSASYWFHAGLPEDAIAGVFGLILLLWALARARGQPGASPWLAVGLAHAFAVLMRKDGVLAAPFILLALVAATTGRARLRAAAAYLVPLATAAGSAYAASYFLVVRPALGPQASFLRWFGKNAVAGDWGRLGLVTPANLWYVAEAFLHAVSPAAGHPALLILVAVALGKLVHAIPPGTLRPWRWWAAGCAAWIALRVLFYTWFDPQNAFMWGIGTLPAVWLAFALAVAGAPRAAWARAAAVTAVAVVAVGTLVGLVIPARGRTYAEEAAVWRAATGPSDVILTHNYPLYLALSRLAAREALFLPRAFRSWWYAMDEGELQAHVLSRPPGAVLYATLDVDGRHEVWTDFVAGARARFERRTPLLWDADRIARFLGNYQWWPAYLGSTARGPVIAWRAVARGQ